MTLGHISLENILIGNVIQWKKIKGHDHIQFLGLL